MFQTAYFNKLSLSLCLLVAVVLWVACDQAVQQVNVTRLPYYNDPAFTPIFAASDDEAAGMVTHRIADFSFTDQHGQKVTQEDIDGKIHVANFIFTSCGSICPRMTENMSRVNQAFESDNDVVLLSYSVTPWIDSVGRLKVYAERNRIKSKNWHLLTGNKAAIYELARKSYFAEEAIGFTKDSTEFLHTEHFILVDRNRQIRGIYNGTLELEMIQLIEDVKGLKKEGV